MKEWFAAHFDHRFGHGFGKRPHPFAKSAGQDCSLDVSFRCHNSAVEDNSRNEDGFVGEAPLAVPLFGPLRGEIEAFQKFSWNGRLHRARRGNSGSCDVVVRAHWAEKREGLNTPPLQVRRNSGRIAAVEVILACSSFCRLTIIA